MCKKAKSRNTNKHIGSECGCLVRLKLNNSCVFFSMWGIIISMKNMATVLSIDKEKFGHCPGSRDAASPLYLEAIRLEKKC